jgi:hypothetical protein
VLAAGAATAAAAALGVAATWRRRSRHGSAELWTCDCGQRYLVRGVDRHRVYWLPDTSQTDPVLERDCLRCGSPLPHGHENPVTESHPVPA